MSPDRGANGSRSSPRCTHHWFEEAHAGMYTTSDFRNGLKIELDGGPFVIVYFQHVKPGKGAGDSIAQARAVEPLCEGGEPIGIDVPFFIDLKIVETEPGVRGDTVSGSTKPAKLESGAVVAVPLFLNEGD